MIKMIRINDLPTELLVRIISDVPMDDLFEIAKGNLTMRFKKLLNNYMHLKIPGI